MFWEWKESTHQEGAEWWITEEVGMSEWRVGMSEGMGLSEGRSLGEWYKDEVGMSGEGGWA